MAQWINSHVWLFALGIPLLVIATLATIFSKMSALPLVRACRWTAASLALLASMAVGVAKHF